IMSSWADFRKQVCAGLSMGIAGIPWWTTDIGGFHGGRPDDEAFRELLVRWFQWGCFCPVMRLHGDRQPDKDVFHQDGTKALFTGRDNEVWSFGDKVYPILVKYLRLRETLRDYTRQLMREAHEQGKPVIRAMYYEFPQDEACQTLCDQYMYGDRYLVAPVMEPGVTERSLYLPKGAAWRHMDSGEIYEGGQRVTVAAPIDSMPVLEKS
ncbi:MAG: glycoside hydrolase family 31 protein, partial [Eubacteriales bacterium]|nr:glycoside hydrolase family 31 protein [Eubacteriales bacterium]